MDNRISLFLKVVVENFAEKHHIRLKHTLSHNYHICLLYTSDAADEEDSVDLGGSSNIQKKNKTKKKKKTKAHT